MAKPIAPAIITDIPRYYLNTAVISLLHVHQQQFDLTQDEIEALFWPPDEREAMRTTLRRMQSGTLRGNDWHDIGDFSVSVPHPDGVLPYVNAPDAVCGAVTLSTVSLRCSGVMFPINAFGLSSAPANLISWRHECEIAQRAVAKLEAWASAVALDVYMAENARIIVHRVLNDAKSLQDARNWLPQLPMMLAYAQGKWEYDGVLRDDYTSGAVAVAASAVSPWIDKISKFKPVTDGYSPDPHMREWLRQIQGWINKAGILMSSCSLSSLYRADKNISFRQVAVWKAPLAT